MTVQKNTRFRNKPILLGTLYSLLQLQVQMRRAARHACCCIAHWMTSCSSPSAAKNFAAARLCSWDPDRNPMHPNVHPTHKTYIWHNHRGDLHRACAGFLSAFSRPTSTLSSVSSDLALTLRIFAASFGIAPIVFLSGALALPVPLGRFFTMAACIAPCCFMINLTGCS